MNVKFGNIFAGKAGGRGKPQNQPVIQRSRADRVRNPAPGRTPRGRILSPPGFGYLGLETPAALQGTSGQFDLLRDDAGEES